jgi:hypothetical protein
VQRARQGSRGLVCAIAAAAAITAQESELQLLRSERLRLQQLIAAKDELLACKDLFRSKCDELKRSQQSSASERSKRLRASCAESSPLAKDDVLDLVFSFVGTGENLYCSINRRWRGRYLRYCALDRPSGDKKLVTSDAAAFITERRLQLAIDCGFSISTYKFTDWKRALLVSKHSLEPQQVMTLCRQHGVQWSEHLAHMAARAGNLRFLQWLRSSVCRWFDHEMLGNASEGGCVDMFVYLQCMLRATTWDDKSKTTMLSYTGWFGHAAAAEWLLAHGAAWPRSFFITVIGSDREAMTNWTQTWTVPQVQW